MEIRQLEIFQALAAELNFTRAAARVHCVQSNVTTQIRALETELGVPLFERLGKKVRLSDAGHRVLPYADQVLRLLREAQSIATESQEPSGKLSIASPESVVAYRLPQVLRRFQQKFPRVELSFLPLFSALVPQQIARGEVDFAFLIGDLIEQRNLVVEDIAPEPMALATSPRHPLAGRKSIRADNVRDETFLLTEHGCSYRVKFEKALAASGVIPHSVIDFDSVEAIKQCAALGMGIAVLPLITLEAELAKGSLVSLPWAGPDLTMATQVAWHKQKRISPTMTAFLSVVREEISTPRLANGRKPL
jgi:DNA-binding transcriptional LysR family regulator